MNKPQQSKAINVDRYVADALASATYEVIQPGVVYGRIPGLLGVSATGKSSRLCRSNLEKVVRGWIELRTATGQTLPVLPVDFGVSAPAY